MSFYFPCITSDIERKEYKEKVDNLYDDLERLIFWEDRLNSEMWQEEKISEYMYLKNVIDRLLNK